MDPIGVGELAMRIAPAITLRICGADDLAQFTKPKLQHHRCAEQPVAPRRRRERLLQEGHVDDGDVQEERQSQTAAQSQWFRKRPSNALRSSERALKTLKS